MAEYPLGAGSAGLELDGGLSRVALPPSQAALDAAHARVSRRRFQPGPLSREVLSTLLEAVAQAPSAYNVQPWRFTVVEEPELKGRLAEAAYGQPQVLSAPAVIVLHTDMQDVMANLEEVANPAFGDAGREGFVERVRAAYGVLSSDDLETLGASQGGIALGYLLLLAGAMGLGTSPMLGFDPAKVRALLGLPGHVRIPALVAIGVPAEEGTPRHRHPLERIVTWR
jgi:nitroreductase